MRTPLVWLALALGALPLLAQTAERRVVAPCALTTASKLTLYWAAPAALTQTDPAIPLCALAPEWVGSMQKLASK
jgi:hypothetical protein